MLQDIWVWDAETTDKRERSDLKNVLHVMGNISTKKCNKSNKIVRSFLEILNLTNGKDSVMITGA